MKLVRTARKNNQNCMWPTTSSIRLGLLLLKSVCKKKFQENFLIFSLILVYFSSTKMKQIFTLMKKKHLIWGWKLLVWKDRNIEQENYFELHFSRINQFFLVKRYFFNRKVSKKWVTKNLQQSVPANHRENFIDWILMASQQERKPSCIKGYFWSPHNLILVVNLTRVYSKFRFSQDG